MKKINKKQLAEETNLTKEQIQKLFMVIAEHCMLGETVVIVGFGEFKVKIRKGRKVLDPQTGIEKKVGPTPILKFRPTSKIKKFIKTYYRGA